MEAGFYSRTEVLRDIALAFAYGHDLQAATALAEAHATLGVGAMFFEWDWPRAFSMRRMVSSDWST